MHDLDVNTRRFKIQTSQEKPLAVDLQLSSEEARMLQAYRALSEEMRGTLLRAAENLARDRINKRRSSIRLVTGGEA